MDFHGKIIKKLPYLSKGLIPKDSYKGAKEDILTVRDWNWIVCSSDLDEETVYQIVKTTFDNHDSLLIINKALENVKLENFAYGVTKLHPGVVKYLKEKNIEIPENLLP